MSTLTAAQFNRLSTFEQNKSVQDHRAGRTNLQCLVAVFGTEVPESATSFHCADGKAIFLDGTKPNWHEPVKEVVLTDSVSHELRMIGMLGTLGWEIHSGGSLANLAERVAADAPAA